MSPKTCVFLGEGKEHKSFSNQLGKTVLGVQRQLVRRLNANVATSLATVPSKAHLEVPDLLVGAGDLGSEAGHRRERGATE